MDTTALTATTAAHAERANTARQQLADKVTSGVPAADLTDYLHRLITAETTHEVYAYTVKMLAHGATADSVRHYLTALALQSPTDTWSGRGNDAERVRADAERAAVRGLLSALAD